MFTKINVIRIFRDHFFTLTDSRREKSWAAILHSHIFWQDIVLFYAIPLIVGILLAFFGIRPSDAVIHVGLVALTIFVPLLINVIFLIHTVLDTFRNRKTENDESERKRMVAIAILQDIFCNISYSILVSLVTILALAGCMITLLSSSFLHGIVYFLATHLLLTGLMILKRLHVLLATSFEE
jgi:hypothetical protein